MLYTEKYINRYGRSVDVCDVRGKVVQKMNCFIQPLRYKNKMYMQDTPTDIGFDHSGYCLLIAPPWFDKTAMGEYGYIVAGNRHYHVDRCDEIYFGSDVLYVWAVLREKNDDSYPVYNHFR
ncbi:MAG: hypothetical protein IKV76_09230 [Clostridia bacterium]|nr:hypothetical protein [Clostridia bacterium]